MATTPAKKKSRAGQSRLDAIDSPIIVGEIVKKDKEIAKAKHAGGRPSDYTPELADEICALVSEGWSSRRIAKLDHMPEMRTIFRWLRTNEEFRQQYTRAKQEEMPDALQEHIHIIAEGTLNGEYDPQAARVAIDAYKWTASKLMPKKYGDKLDLTSDGKALPTPLLGGVTIENNSHMTLSDQQNG